MSNEQQLAASFQQLVLGYLVDLHGGQVTIPVQDLQAIEGLVVRMAINMQTHMITLTLLTEDDATAHKKAVS